MYMCTFTNRWKRRFTFHTQQMRNSCCYGVIKVVYRQVMFTWFSHRNTPETVQSLLIMNESVFCSLLLTLKLSEGYWTQQGKQTSNTTVVVLLLPRCPRFGLPTQILKDLVYTTTTTTTTTETTTTTTIHLTETRIQMWKRIGNTDPPLTVKSEAVSRRG